jgi:hypothetical protein
MGRPGLEPGTNPRKLSGLLSFSQFIFLIQCQNHQLRILFAFEFTFRARASLIDASCVALTRMTSPAKRLVV